MIYKGWYAIKPNKPNKTKPAENEAVEYTNSIFAEA